MKTTCTIEGCPRSFDDIAARNAHVHIRHSNDSAAEVDTSPSYNDTREMLGDELREYYQDAFGRSPYVWVCDFGAAWVVFEVGDKLFRTGYVISGGGTDIDFDGTIAEVVRRTIYMEVIEDPADTAGDGTVGHHNNYKGFDPSGYLPTKSTDTTGMACPDCGLGPFQGDDAKLALDLHVQMVHRNVKS